MSRNGSGLYTLPAGNPVVTGTVVSSTWANSTLTDIGTALTQSIASTGVTTPTANLPMGGYRHTGVGNATVRAAYSSVTDIQNGSLVTLGSVSGSDTITATAPFTLSAYASGQGFQFIAAGANTGAVTLNIDTLGAKAITKQGSNPLTVGDITSGQVVEVVYDGTQFQMTNARPVTQVGVAMQAFTSSGTYTPTNGMQYCVMHMVGGGGGGAQLASSTSGGGGGGGAGEYATGVFTAAAIGASKAVTIGAGGGAGSNGGTTSVGTLLTAAGGSGGTLPQGAAGGTGGTGTGLHVPGGQGATGSGIPGPILVGGSGGASWFGSGGRGGLGNLDSGQSGTAYGSGGGGNGNLSGVWSNAGSGAGGCVVIYEYF